MLHRNFLKQLDLKDINTFLMLYEWRSARKTAEKMNISQSTVSYSLKRLRECFNDVLFEFTQGKLIPTEKAEKMVPYLKVVLDSVNKCAGTEVNNYALHINKVIHYSAPEYFELLILPDLIHSLIKEKTGSSFYIDRLNKTVPVEKIISGEIDLAVGFGPGYHQIHPELSWEPIVEEKFICLTSYNINTTEPLHLDDFCSMLQVYPTPWISEKNMVDGWLEMFSKKRHIIAKANTYQACINIISKTTATFALPSRLIHTLHIPENVHCCEPPLGFPHFTVDMFWAKKRENTDELRTLRALITKIAQQYSDK
ncbi:LysR family transcriptional regulator [Pectobacteriaceae bacterium CE70]|nr:LysR family transcriptional regulator [Pectobacteriaceae bacterium CE70]